MKGENPFTSDFWAGTGEFISRTDQIGKIINTFDMENPSNMVYMIAGVRGSGKTVSLAVIGDHYNANEDWIVLRLSADMDLISGAVFEVKPNSEDPGIDLGININIGIAEIAFQ